MSTEFNKTASLAADIFEKTWEPDDTSASIFDDALDSVNEILSQHATGQLTERLTAHQANVLMEASDVLQGLRSTAEARHP